MHRCKSIKFLVKIIHFVYDHFDRSHNFNIKFYGTVSVRYTVCLV